MMDRGLWSRIRRSRLVGVLAVYLGASWLLIQVANELREALDLPAWVSPVAVLLLLIGLLIVLATAWVQSHPATPQRAAREEVPGSWELDLGELAGSIRRGRLPHLTWSRAILGGVVAFSLLFGFAGLYVLIRDRGRSFAPPAAVAEEAAPGVAVLPFTVRGQGLEPWREGIVDLLSINLDGAAGLRAIDSRTVLARWHARVPEGEDPELQVALGVARGTGARHAVLGSAVAAATGMRITATVRELSNGRVVGEARVEGSPDSIFALIDKLSVSVLPALLGEENPSTGFDLGSLTTRSFDALKAYLEGEAFYRRGDFDEAISAYERAIGSDSTFALAHYRLAAALGWTPERGSPRVREVRARLTALADRLPTREALLARAADAYVELRPGLVDSLRVAVRRYPDDPEAWYLLGETYFHVPRAVMPPDSVRGAFERAVELDPGAVPYQIHLLDLAFGHEPDSARTAVLLRRFEGAASGSGYVSRYQAAFELAYGDSATRAAAMHAVDTLSAEEILPIAGIVRRHPRFWPVAEHLLRLQIEKTNPAGRARTLSELAEGSFFNRGRLRDAIAYIDAAAGEGQSSEARWLCSLFYMHLSSRAVPDDVLHRHASSESLERLRVGVARPWPLACGALIAGFEGRWSDFERLRSRLMSAPDLPAFRADSTQRERIVEVARYTDALGTWLRGRPGEAADSLMELDEVFPQDIGQAVLEAGRAAEAVPWLEAGAFGAASDPLSRLSLGKAYEALGRHAEARAAYEYFLTWWGEADPEVAHLVEEARDGLERIAAVLN